MARLGIAKEFLADYAKLQKPVQRAVDSTIERFAQHTHAGLHLEKLANAKDPRIRTIRVTNFYRGVVLAPDAGDEFLLLAVMPHDDAIAYAVSRRFTVNQALGVLEVRNQEALDSIEPALRQAATQTPRLLFDGVKDAELIRLGIDADVLPLVRVMATEAHLQALANLLPAPQFDALTGLAAGLTPEQVWEEVSQQLVGGPPERVDTEDIAAAAARTPDRFVLVSGPDELAQILAHPFDAWRIFLHPTQREVAYRPSYAGPALVAGGAGTGKTVVALHRSVHLAQRAPERPILLTTFTRNLAEALDHQLGLLTDDPDVRGRIEVLNVDRLAYRVVAESLGRQIAIAGASRSERTNDYASGRRSEASPTPSGSATCTPTSSSPTRRPGSSASGRFRRTGTSSSTRARISIRRSGACCGPPRRPDPTTCSSSRTRTSASTTTTSRSAAWASRPAAAAGG